MALLLHRNLCISFVSALQLEGLQPNIRTLVILICPASSIAAVNQRLLHKHTFIMYNYTKALRQGHHNLPVKGFGASIGWHRSAV
jgi:hypothetical protein